MSEMSTTAVLKIGDRGVIRFATAFELPVGGGTLEYLTLSRGTSSQSIFIRSVKPCYTHHVLSL